MLNAKIIIIGNEILNGFTKDLNSRFLIKNLLNQDVLVDSVVFIKDEVSLIVQELNNIKSVDFVFLTGGLGPTSDDVTLEALDSFFDKKKPKLINNKIGTAPGLWYQKKETNYVAFPGVPSEMQLMALNFFLHFFQKKKIKNNFLQVNTIGVPESKLAILLNQFEKEIPKGYIMSYLPDNIIVKLRFHKKTDNTEDVFSVLKNKLNNILGNLIFSYGEVSLQHVIVSILIKKKIKIAIAESCTGGAISKILTSIPGCSQVLIGSVIAYSEYTKTEILNVNLSTIKKHGVVSKEVVEEMAKSVMKKFNSSFGLATSGFMGPFDKQDEKTAWLCVASKKKIITKKIILKSTRSNNILITTRSVLNELRKEIL